jgi:hypothetical protein
MKIDKAKLDELKEKNSAVYEGKISFTDDNDKSYVVEFIFREPTTADVEAYAKNAQVVGGIVANLNLIQSLIVYPEAAPVIESIRDYPNAYGKFIEAVVQPFFGANVQAEKKRL